MLSVYFNGQYVAKLWLENKDYYFQYVGLDVPAISLTLPVQKAPYKNDEAKPYFANLLPEGEARTAIETHLGVSRGDDYALLRAIGGDCAGAVTVFPEGVQPSDKPAYTLLTQSELAKLLRNLPKQPLHTSNNGKIRLSLPGVQHKIALYFDGKEYYLPQNGSASSHILKIPITNIPGVVHTVENETFTMTLASKVGLNVPQVEQLCINGMPVFMTARFDRHRDESGRLQRILQEDICQLMGYEPTMKYQNTGGPGLEDCANIIRQYSSDSLADIEQLIRWALYNVVVGNADAHAKNIAIIQHNGAIRLAPFYDLLSTTVYGSNLDTGLAMSIGREYDPGKISRENLLQLAEFLDVKLRLIQQVGLNMVEQITASVAATALRHQEKYGENSLVQAVAAQTVETAAKLYSLLKPVRG